MREQYCQTSERAEADYMFPPKDEPTLVSELERVQDLLDSRPRPLVNYSSTDESESDYLNQMLILQTMKTMIISLVKWHDKRFRVSYNISSFY